VIENEPKDLEEFIDLTKANKEAVIPPRCPFSKTSDKNENRGMKIARPTPSYLFERGHPISIKDPTGGSTDKERKAGLDC